MEREEPLARRLITTFVLLLCLVLILHLWGLEAFVVPTGSMAPALAGNHRSSVCPRCGFVVQVGRQASDPDGRAGDECYATSFCPNCGQSSLHLGSAPEARGDHILVHKGVFLFRRPRRWEIIVFRLFGKIYIKRVVGLPGEWLEIVDGDIVLDGNLARKTLEECRHLRMLVFDHDHQPSAGGWVRRWEYQAPAREAGDLLARVEESEHDPARDASYHVGKDLVLEAASSPHDFHWLTYHHFSFISGKDEAVRDEYAYNGGSPPAAHDVHDFVLECDVEVSRGTGAVGLGITDGWDVVRAELPAGGASALRVVQENSPLIPPRGTSQRVLAESSVTIHQGRTYHVELAFVDRRLSLAIDGVEVIGACDLPRIKERPGVDRPFALGARGVDATFRHIRLYRDVHYTQAGRNGVNGQVVHLAMDQYFVLGDNSPNSEDSRFWPRHGAIPRRSLLGKPFLVHLPSRAVAGSSWQLPDWGRFRWLH